MCTLNVSLSVCIFILCLVKRYVTWSYKKPNKINPPHYNKNHSIGITRSFDTNRFILSHSSDWMYNSIYYFYHDSLSRHKVSRSTICCILHNTHKNTSFQLAERYPHQRIYMMYLHVHVLTSFLHKSPNMLQTI